MSGKVGVFVIVLCEMLLIQDIGSNWNLIVVSKGGIKYWY